MLAQNERTRTAKYIVGDIVLFSPTYGRNYGSVNDKEKFAPVTGVIESIITACCGCGSDEFCCPVRYHVRHELGFNVEMHLAELDKHNSALQQLAAIEIEE